MNSFRNYVNRKYSLNIRTFKELHTWSVSDTEAFASAIWVFCGINCSVPPTKVASGLDLMFPPPRWFPGAKLNFSQNILCTGLAVRPFGVAVSACREDGVVTELTFLELEARVAIWANALRKFNVGVGDRIASKHGPLAVFGPINPVSLTVLDFASGSYQFHRLHGHSACCRRCGCDLFLHITRHGLYRNYTEV